MAHLRRAQRRIAGVTVTTQRSTVINLDADGEPLRPAIVWLDQRRTGDAAGRRAVGIAFSAGMAGTVAHLQADAEANWLRRHQPDIWAATHKYLFLSGFLIHRLTGRYADSVGSQVGYIPFDYKALIWSQVLGLEVAGPARGSRRAAGAGPPRGTDRHFTPQRRGGHWHPRGSPARSRPRRTRPARSSVPALSNPM